MGFICALGDISYSNRYIAGVYIHDAYNRVPQYGARKTINFLLISKLNRR